MTPADKHDATIHDMVRGYFDDKISTHGPNHLGVGWNSRASQELRFAQLCRLFERHEGPFSVNDVGCGYGLFLEYLNGRGFKTDYLGFDVSALMIEAANKLYPPGGDHRFVVASRSPRTADYCVSSGAFNVKMAVPQEEWQAHVSESLDMMAGSSSRGFAFNLLTKYSDADRMVGDLYYADPEAMFAHCKKRYSRNVALLHDYDLYEFTILVRKMP